MRPCLIAAVLVAASVTSASADTYVNGYLRRDGTYVPPHYRTNPDSNLHNNYSTRGNTNPYTGEHGTVDPYSQKTNPLRSYDPSVYTNPYAPNRKN